MLRLTLIITALGLFIFLSTAPTLLAQGPPPNSMPTTLETPYVSGEILVKFRPAVSRLSGQRRLAAAGLHPLQVATYSGLMRVRVPPGREADIIAQLRARDDVEFAALNQILSGSGSPNDTDFTSQWGLNNTGQSGGTTDADIDAPEAWDIETGDASVIIAIVDSGVDLDHPDLQANIIAGYDFVNNDTDPDDDFGHGTHVAGIAAAVGNNNLGVAGVSWGSKIMPVKVIASNNSATVFNVVQGIDYAVANGADIINLSLGGSSYPDCVDENNASNQIAIQTAIVAATEKGILVTAASGNSGSNSVQCPAAFDEVIAVGSTTHTDARSSFSNRGNRLDVVAPGGSGSPFDDMNDIYSTTNDGSYGYLAGTSMSTPFVSGLAALLWSHNPNLSNSDVRSIIEATVDDLGTTGFDTSFGHGRINAQRALEASASLQTTPPEINVTLTQTQFPAMETIDLSSNDTSDVSWTAIVSPTVTWLNLPTSAGTVSVSSPATVTLNFTPPPTFGVYSTTVVISGTNDSGLAVGQRSTEVHLSYQDTSTLLQTSPTEIEITLSDDDFPAIRSIQLTSSDLSEVNWIAVIAPTAPWLDLSASAGVVSTDSPTTLPLTFTRPVTFGVYSATVVISGTSSSNLPLDERATNVTLTYQTGKSKYYQYLPLLLK